MDTSTMMCEHDEDEQNLEPDRVYREEVDRHELGHMIGEERSPRLGWCSRRAAPQNPTTGEIIRDNPTSLALAQFTPSPNTRPFVIKEFARPTPMIEPIKVCELDAG